MVLRYKRKMQLYLQKRLRIDACPAVLFQNRDNCFSLLCFLPCLHVHIITFFFSSFLPSFSPFFRLFFLFLFHLLNFMARQISKASAAHQTKYFPLLLDQSKLCWLLVSCCFFFWGGGGGEGGNTRRFCTLSNIIHHTCQERLPIVTWCYKLKKANDAYLNQSLDDF